MYSINNILIIDYNIYNIYIHIYKYIYIYIYINIKYIYTCIYIQIFKTLSRYKVDLSDTISAGHFPCISYERRGTITFLMNEEERSRFLWTKRNDHVSYERRGTIKLRGHFCCWNSILRIHSSITSKCKTEMGHVNNDTTWPIEEAIITN